MLVRLLLKLLNRKKPAQQDDIKLETIALAPHFCGLAVALFCLQGIIANLGAIHLVYPDLPSPVSFQAGRAVHLNLALAWTLIGAIGAAYYFTIQECKHELYSPKLARLQFWLILFTVAGTLLSLTLGITAGREYLEAHWVFKLLLSIILLIFAFNLSMTIQKSQSWSKLTLLARALASASLIVYYLPNIFPSNKPVVDEMKKFLVVHIWEEMSFELFSSSLLAYFFLRLAPLKRSDLEKMLSWEIYLAISAGLFSTGHHYYWIGTNGLWIFAGSIFSFILLIPILLMAYQFYQAYQSRKEAPAGKNKVTLLLITSSIFHHLTGAGLLGFLLSIPHLNLYLHGTYLTSAHAHLALFGSLGFLILAACFYILTDESSLNKKEITSLIRSIIFLNTGVLIMAFFLVLAGLLQVYLHKLSGVNFMQVQTMLMPLLLARSAGGLFYAAGALLFTWTLRWPIIKILFRQVAG